MSCARPRCPQAQPHRSSSFHHLPCCLSSSFSEQYGVQRNRGQLMLKSCGPALKLFARSAFAVATQGLVAAIYATHGSGTPWRDAGAWLPVYGTLIDAGCLCLPWWLAQRKGITVLDLIGFDRKREGRVLGCLALCSKPMPVENRRPA